MYLSKETTMVVTDTQSNIIRHMGYAACKLWNVCNYERKIYTPSSGKVYPDWYYQKAVHKENIWYKSLPSQTAQEVCKVLDKAWKSYFVLKRTGGIENPKPPRYKQEAIPITYMQNGIKKISETKVRLALPIGLKKHMSERYDIHEKYLFLENKFFKDMESIKQITLYMPKDKVIRIIVVYEVPDVPALPDNRHYLSIDLGIHNLMTCFDSDGKSFILGRKYLSIARKYDKEIARVQSQWAEQQVKKGIKCPKPSKHILSLYQKKNHCIKDYLHKVTRYLASYCHKQQINTVIIGDITGIRKTFDKGDKSNQKMHSLPYKRITEMLQYKLALLGIRLITVCEAYSSQCSPLSPSVSRRYAQPDNRKFQGVYIDSNQIWNADAVGAYNILRLYLKKDNPALYFSPKGLSDPKITKVAV